MQKNSTKISLGMVICIFIIIVLVAALGIVYYLGFVKDTEELTNTFSTNNTELMMSVNKEDEVIESQIKNKDKMDTEDTILTSDLVTLYYEANNERVNVFYAYIEDGYLYYINNYAEGNGVSEGAFDFYSTFITSSINNGRMEKYTNLSNIKRMKTYNIGTGVNPVPFLITENGEVYTINYLLGDDIEISKYEVLKNYEVKDILSHTGEMYSVFEILLKDGTIKTVTVGMENM